MSRRLDFVGIGPIIFEGGELPAAAKLFECVPFWEKLPQTTREWLMDLRYCWGRTRRLNSRRIIRHVHRVRQKLNEEREHAQERLQRNFPKATEAELEETVADWHRSLHIIEECAQHVQTLQWTIIAQDECLEANLGLAIKMVNDGVGGAPPLAKQLAPGFEFRLRSRPREEQLDWLAEFSDAFTKREPAVQRLWQCCRQIFGRRPSSKPDADP